jgi:CHAD domain-containing protein
MEPYIYIGYSGIRAGKLEKLLPVEPGYEIAVQKGDKRPCTLLDTFDNHLLQDALFLLQVGKTLILLDLKRGLILEQTGQKHWSFAQELAEGPIRSILEKTSEIRAYLPVAEVNYRFDLGLLLDDEAKTRARFHNLTLYNDDKTISVGTTQYLRGYQKAHVDLTETLVSLGTTTIEECYNLYTKLGIKRNIYDPKPSIPLLGNATAKDSATTIINTFIKVARENEPGVVADFDTEFLHDYRVSFRKVRSVLSLFKSVFSPDITEQLKTDFADIMQSTNKLRDLDVYLLERDNYFKLIPQTSHTGLTILFNYLQKERKKEHKKVTKNLKSKQYKSHLAKLEKTFAKSNRLPAGLKGDQASLEFGAKLILKRYNQVCRIAHTINAETEDEVVHRLRISCKKLRYLMEFFTPLFPQNEIKSLIRTLKVLQDNLGNFNDYSVQQNFLRQIVQTDLAQFNEQEILVTESIGALNAMLFRLQRKERKQVMKNFSLFDSDESKVLFKKLFKDIEVN